MASKLGKGKKVVVKQDELRRLMREKQQQKQSSERQKRVESPFARYSASGQLSCALCHTALKSELLWNAHVLGKAHKDKVAQLKRGEAGDAPAPQLQPPPLPGLKRKEPGVQEKTKALSDEGPEKKREKTTHSAGLGLLAGQYDDESGEEEESATTAAKGNAEQEKEGGLPADFFDSGIPSVPSVSHSGSISKPEEEEKAVEKKENTAEALPEGFFDDPLRDAKVRNVDTPKDQMDKEWEEFQREMRQVNSASDAIVAEDDEEGRIERQIDEIDEQIECYRRVEVLRDRFDKKEKLMRPSETEDEQGLPGSDEEDEEEELLHVLSRDWRAKGALA